MAKRKQKKKRKVKATNNSILSRIKKAWQLKKSIILYTLSFIFFLLIFSWLGEQAFFEKFSKPLLNIYAYISSFILNILGQGTNASSEVISSAQFSISIRKGCDAIAPMALYIVAILAYPIPKRFKWKGILFGIGFLFLLNIIRIVSLYLIGAHANQIFDFAHVQFWQVMFIIFTVLAWLFWLKWAQKDQNSHETT